MRNTFNLSIPKDKKIPAFTLRGYVRHLIKKYRTWRLLKDIEAGEKEYREGKAKILHSFADLD